MAKDAKGHGSEKRGGGMVKVSVDPAKFGYRIADAGPGGTEHNVKTGGAWNADHEAAYQLARGNPKVDAAPTHPSMAGGGSVVPRDVAANFARGGKYGARLARASPAASARSTGSSGRASDGLPQATAASYSPGNRGRVRCGQMQHVKLQSRPAKQTGGRTESHIRTESALFGISTALVSTIIHGRDNRVSGYRRSMKYWPR